MKHVKQRNLGWLMMTIDKAERLNVIKWHVKCLFLGYVLASSYKGLHSLSSGKPVGRMYRFIWSMDLNCML